MRSSLEALVVERDVIVGDLAVVVDFLSDEIWCRRDLGGLEGLGKGKLVFCYCWD